MSLQLEFDIEIDNTNGQTMAFTDTTTNYGVGGNINYSAVKATRFLFQNYLDTSSVQTLQFPQSLSQFFEYIKIGGGVNIYDNKIISDGNIFIPFVDLPVSGGDTWETLGIYSPYISPSNYLPTQIRNRYFLNPSDWGINETVFPSTIYGLQYEIYVDAPSPLTNVVQEKQYIVVGDDSDTCTYDNSTYRVGEVFIAVDNGAVTFTGNATLKVLHSSRQKYYTFAWGLYNRLYNLIHQKLTCECVDTDMMYLLYTIQAELLAMKWANLTQRISIAKTQKTINWINEKLTLLENENN